MRRAGFEDRGGKGSHRNFVHPDVDTPVTISGNPGDDAKDILDALSLSLFERSSSPRGEKGNRGSRAMRDSDRYAKIVEWSEEDGCYIGSAPGLIHGGCHGADQRAVFDELCQIVEEAVQLFRQDGKPLPPATAGLGVAPANKSAA